jgi:hypothetical protein
MSGLSINFDKSEVHVMGMTNPEQRRVANMLNCRLGQFPMKYLGFPVSDKPLRAHLVGHLLGKTAG